MAGKDESAGEMCIGCTVLMEENATLRTENETLKELCHQYTNATKSTDEKVKKLEKKLADLQKFFNDQEKQLEAPLPWKRIYVPPKLYEKQHKHLLDKLLGKCDVPLENVTLANGSFESVNAQQISDGKSQKSEAESVAKIIPCVLTSRIGSDLDHTFEDAGLDKAREHLDVIVVIFTPKAPHVEESSLSTFQKMGDEFKVKDMVDVVFFGDDFYPCRTNKRAMEQMKKILAL